MQISENLRNSLDDHLERIKESVIERAIELSENQDDSKIIEVKFNNLARAINEYAPGNIVATEKKQGWFLQLFPPFTLVCAFLAMVFAVCGIWSADSGGKIGPASGFIDIAKIFAGAIVGSTSATVSNTISKKRQTRP